MWYEVDLVAGPLDGKSYAFPNLPPEIHFPTFDAPHGLAWAVAQNEPLHMGKLIYKHVVNGLYLYYGKIE